MNSQPHAHVLNTVVARDGYGDISYVSLTYGDQRSFIKPGFSWPWLNEAQRAARFAAKVEREAKAIVERHDAASVKAGKVVAFDNELRASVGRLSPHFDGAVPVWPSEDLEAVRAMTPLAGYADIARALRAGV